MFEMKLAMIVVIKLNTNGNNGYKEV